MGRDTVRIQNIRFARRAFFVYAANGIAAALGVALATLCDAVVVGNAFGEVGLAITSVVMPVYILYNFISFALGIGGGTLVSQAFGREDRKGAQDLFSQCLALALLCSVPIALLGSLFLAPVVSLLGGGSLGEPCLRYVGAVIAGAPVFVAAPVLSLALRADGDPGRSTAGVILSSCVNLVLDLVFLFGLGTGVEGAAWAMVIGQGCAVAVYLPHFFQKKYALRLRLALPTPARAAALLRGGAGTASAYIWQFCYLSVFNNLVAGVSGAAGLAVLNLVFNLSMLTSAIADGIAQTIPALAGTYQGEQDHFSLDYTVRLSLKTALIAALALAALLLCLTRPVIALFGVSDPAVLSAGVIAARIYCLAIPFTCVNSTLCACWQAMGYPRLALIVQLLRGCLLVLGSGVPLILLLGSGGAAAALTVGEALALPAALLLARARKRRTGACSVLLLPPPACEGAVYEDVLDGQFHRLPEIVQAVEDFCEQQDIPPATAYSIHLTIEELGSNIIRYGFQDQKPHYIAFKVARYGEEICVRIRDDATSYDPFDSQRGDELDSLGVELVRRRAKRFIYQRRLIFNNLLIIL